MKHGMEVDSVARPALASLCELMVILPLSTRGAIAKLVLSLAWDSVSHAGNT
jgi:hypothetical protein